MHPVTLLLLIALAIFYRDRWLSWCRSLGVSAGKFWIAFQEGLHEAKK